MNALLTIAEHKHGCEGQLPSNRSESKSLEAGEHESIELGKERSKVRRNGEKTVLPPFEDKEEESWRKKKKDKVHHKKIASVIVPSCGWCA